MGLVVGLVSRPPWARELKLAYGVNGTTGTKSRPPWARELKPRSLPVQKLSKLSRPPWARELKQRSKFDRSCGLKTSRPPWARELKQIVSILLCLRQTKVAPPVGA